MAVEVAERLQEPLDWWLAQPAAFVAWTLFQIRDLDRRREWVERMNRIEQAELIALAFHEPKRLQDERERVLGDAANRDAEEYARIRAKGLDLVAEMVAVDLGQRKVEVLTP